MSERLRLNGTETIASALPKTRKVDAEIHLLDPDGKTVAIIRGCNRDLEALREKINIDRVYDYVIPLSKRYIFYCTVEKA